MASSWGRSGDTALGGTNVSGVEHCCEIGSSWRQKTHSLVVDSMA